MADHDQADALLASVTGFLVGSDASCTTSLGDAPSKSDPDSLLLSSHQLVAETETLLSSLDDSLLGANSTPTISKTTAEPVLSEKRREVRNAQAAQRRLRYRQKLKSERETLRQQESQLSQELKELQQARFNEENGRQVDRMALSVWKAIATRQKERRLEAEAQQRQLRAAAIGRARLIHQVNALLQRPDSPEQKLDEVEEQHGGSVLFKTLLGELDELYAQTDRVMGEKVFKVTSPLVYKPTRTYKQGVEIFESADATVVPFGFEQTCHAMSFIMMTDPAVVRSGKEVREPLNTVTVKYQIKSQLKPSESYKLMVYAAVRRYREPGRMVFVWRALHEGLDTLSGHHANETGWLALRPNLGSCVMESYVRLVPASVGDAARSKVSSDRFAEVVLKTGEDEVNELMVMLEKTLLGETKVSA